MADTVLQLESAWWTGAAGRAEWTPTTGERPLIAPALVEGGGPAYLEQFSAQNLGVIIIRVRDSAAGGNSVDLASLVETNGSFVIETANGSLFVAFAGADTVGPYTFFPDNAAEIIAFANAHSTADIAGTLTIRDSIATAVRAQLGAVSTGVVTGSLRPTTLSLPHRATLGPSLTGAATGRVRPRAHSLPVRVAFPPVSTGAVTGLVRPAAAVSFPVRVQFGALSTGPVSGSMQEPIARTAIAVRAQFGAVSTGPVTGSLATPTIIRIAIQRVVLGSVSTGAVLGQLRMRVVIPDVEAALRVLLDEVILRGRPVSIILPPAADADENTRYSLTGLPAGLTFDPDTREVSGSTSVDVSDITVTYRIT